MKSSNPLAAVQPQVVIMDLAGTIIDSLAVDMQTIDVLSRKYVGIGYSDLGGRRDPSKSTRANFPSIFGEKAPQAYAEYIEQLIGNIGKTSLFQGVRSFLKSRAAHDTPVYVVSNRPADYIHTALSAKKIDTLVTGAFSAFDDLKAEKPSAKAVEIILARTGHKNIPRDKVAIIGDSHVDILFADNAGCTPVIYTKNQLEADKPLIAERLERTKPQVAYAFSEYRQLVTAWNGSPTAAEGASAVRHFRPRRQPDRKPAGAGS